MIIEEEEEDYNNGNSTQIVYRVAVSKDYSEELICENANEQKIENIVYKIDLENKELEKITPNMNKLHEFRDKYN